MTSVAFEDVERSFGSTRVLQRFSLAIASGQFMTLLGPSGCGKTTTLRLLAGLLRPDRGRIFMGERLVADAARTFCLPPEARNVGLVFQSYALWPHMTVLENVAYPLKVRKTDGPDRGRQAKRMLELVHLTALADRYPWQLSGGQQQRVALARALVFRPDVLLLDEPLSNLDERLREDLRGELKDIQRQTGNTTVLVTHDQREAMALSDELVVMEAGQVLQRGSPEALYARPATRFVAEFMGVADLLPGNLDASGHFRHLGQPLAAQTVTRSDGITPEAAVLAVVRPEQWQPCAPDLPGAVPVVVDSSMYLGDSSEYRVHSTAAPIGTWRVRLASGAPPLVTGATVGLRPHAYHIISG